VWRREDMAQRLLIASDMWSSDLEVARGADLKFSKLNQRIISDPTRLKVLLGRHGVRSIRN
jgi:hypothetical protein